MFKKKQPIPLVPPLNPLTDRRLVLIVDDEPAQVSLNRRFLEEENFEILTAASGDEAMEVIEKHGRMPDLLITDFMMPGMNGRELATALRARQPQLRVLYQTGYSEKLFGPRELLGDHESFLEKPLTSRGLREAARLALNNTIG